MREKLNEIRRAKAVNIEWDFVCDANAKQEDDKSAYTSPNIVSFNFWYKCVFCKLIFSRFCIVEFLNSSAANGQKEWKANQNLPSEIVDARVFYLYIYM